MDVATFTNSLLSLSTTDFRTCAAGLNAEVMSVADEIVQWRAELAIDRLLRRHGTRGQAQQAAAAAQRASRVVVDVARQRGIDLPDGDVTCVARAAGQIARGLALGALAGPHVQLVLDRFEAALNGAPPRVLTAA